METVGVIIPTYHPDHTLRTLLLRLKKQSRRPDRILLINTEEKLMDPELLNGIEGIELIHIRKEEFDHGGTRNLGAENMDTDILVYMTMDAVPADTHLLEELIRPLKEGKAVCAYARQLPAEGAHPLERYTRQFNYGPTDRIKSIEDLPVLGIKTYFCSNVCAAYSRKVFFETGKFPDRTIFNEDMIYAAHVMQAGYKTAYAAKARVIHSHNYSGRQQLSRNFDLGVSQAQFPDVFGKIKSEGEGIKMIKEEAKWLVRERQLRYLPRLMYISGCKYIGYRLGKKYDRLPKAWITRLTMNPQYWHTRNT